MPSPQRLLQPCDAGGQQVLGMLEMLRDALQLQTCALLAWQPSTAAWHVVEAATAPAALALSLQTSQIVAGSGVLGAIVQQAAPVVLAGIRPGYRGLGFYRDATSAKHFFGVPLLRGASVEAILCADRLLDRPFETSERRQLQQAAELLQQSLASRELLLRLERSHAQQDVLYRASCALGEARDQRAAIAAALVAAQSLVDFDVAVVTGRSTSDARCSVIHAQGRDAARWRHAAVDEERSLHALAMRNRHCLPYRSSFAPQCQAVLTGPGDFAGYRSLLILPLIVQEEAIGTLLLAARDEECFPLALRSLLQVLSNQLAVSIANAVAVERLQALATTDPLTGCLNKAVFAQQLEQRLRFAARFGRQLSLLIVDLDHFKRVNDEHGHAMGDRVIRALGAILHEAKRDTDLVARFGGEEFCVLCEQTDAEGARRLAERIRQEMQSQVFASGLSVTCSLGIATFPRHASDARELFDRADRALYDAKETGRNQVRVSQARVSGSGNTSLLATVQHSALQPNETAVAVARREACR